ncbi:MAG: SprT-like domain-containing protein [Candidatus Sedimenticola endophacoides]
MNRDALRVRALEYLATLQRQAESHYGRRLGRIEVRFDLRGQGAGQARFAPGAAPLIRLNEALLEAHGEHFIQCTVPHELAHVVTHRIHGAAARPHGPEWREVMELFGAEPSRCHNFETLPATTRTLRRFSYRCGCRTHLLTSIRHNRIGTGTRYYCHQCGERLIRDTAP